MKKADLRKIYKQKRAALTVDEITDLQKNIYQQIEKLDFDDYQNIHIFLTIQQQKEIDTNRLIRFLREKNKNIIVSKSYFKTNTLTHFLLEKNTKLELNKYGIPEPVSAELIDEKQIDLIFVPLLISDKQNYRVGYGKGFYDRFISKCRKDVITIGLNFFKPIDTIDDINEFDIALDDVIYPKSSN